MGKFLSLSYHFHFDFLWAFCFTGNSNLCSVEVSSVPNSAWWSPLLHFSTVLLCCQMQSIRMKNFCPYAIFYVNVAEDSIDDIYIGMTCTFSQRWAASCIWMYFLSPLALIYKKHCPFEPHALTVPPRERIWPWTSSFSKDWYSNR